MDNTNEMLTKTFQAAMQWVPDERYHEFMLAFVEQMAALEANETPMRHQLRGSEIFAMYVVALMRVDC